jgi:hypothetical protein
MYPDAVSQRYRTSQLIIGRWQNRYVFVVNAFSGNVRFACFVADQSVPQNTGLKRRCAVAALLTFCSAARPSPAAENLPVTPAESLAGQKLEFPTVLAGKPAVCVFGFSKEAGERTGSWMTELSRDGIDSWSIANLEGAPVLVRGMIRASMRKGTPRALLARSLILTRDEKSWKVAVGAKQDNLPVVVLFDAKGRILWTYEGLFDSQAYRELKTELAAAIAGK